MRDNRSKAERDRVGIHKAKRLRQKGLTASAEAKRFLYSHALVMTVATLTRDAMHPEVRYAPPPEPRPDRYRWHHLGHHIHHDDEYLTEIAFKVLHDGDTGVNSLPREPLFDAVSRALPGYKVISLVQSDSTIIDHCERKVFTIKVVTEDIFEEYMTAYREASNIKLDAYRETDRSWWPSCSCEWCSGERKPRRTVKQELAREEWYPRED